MDDLVRVWLMKRACKNGKTTYHLRWICPDKQKWRSRAVGSDRRKADREAAELERELNRGTYTDLRPITWAEFAKEHVAKIPGRRHAAEVRHVLDAFGKEFGVPPKRVTYGMVEAFVQSCKMVPPADPKPEADVKEADVEKLKKRRRGRPRNGNSPATINKKLRCLRAAFNMAMKRGYIAKNPMDGWRWERENRKTLRIASDEDEAALLATAERLYGFQWRTFIAAALGTGARRGELLGLTWDRVDLDGASVLFTQTKGKRDRRVPIPAALVDDLRRLQVQTLKAGGPFVGMQPTMQGRWGKIVEGAKVEPIKLHDLRRTYVTRSVRAGVPLPTVQRLAGHSAIRTTLMHYNEVTEDDMRSAVKKMFPAVAS